MHAASRARDHEDLVVLPDAGHGHVAGDAGLALGRLLALASAITSMASAIFSGVILPPIWENSESNIDL